MASVQRNKTRHESKAYCIEMYYPIDGNTLQEGGQ